MPLAISLHFASVLFLLYDNSIKPHYQVFPTYNKSNKLVDVYTATVKILMKQCVDIVDVMSCQCSIVETSMFSGNMINKGFLFVPQLSFVFSRLQKPSHLPVLLSHTVTR